MNIALHCFTLILFVYLLTTLTYLLILAVAGRFGKLASWSATSQKARIAIIIPSYKEDNIIVDTASQALLQNYPADRFSVTVVADHLRTETVQKLRELPVDVLEVNWEKGMKARSLNAAFNHLPADHYDLALILDADNIMAQGCLEKINHAYQNGWQAIQCHRTAKNKNNAIAILDAMSEEINNTLFRRGQRALGLSCALIGSAMAFRYQWLKEVFALPGIQENPGEDKEVELQLLRQGILVEYIEDAFVYDEKVQRKENFQRQRTRWLATQLSGLRPLLARDLRVNFTKGIYLHKVFEWLLLPRSLLMLLLALLTGICAIDAGVGLHILFPAWYGWLVLDILFLATFLLAIPASFYNRATWNAMLKIPSLLLAMLKALLGVKKNKSGFLHTPKEFTKEPGNRPAP